MVPTDAVEYFMGDNILSVRVFVDPMHWRMVIIVLIDVYLSRAWPRDLCGG